MAVYKLKKDEFGKLTPEIVPIIGGYLLCNGANITPYKEVKEDLDKVIEEYWN